MLTSNIIVEQF